MKLKRILAAIIAASTLSFNGFAFTPFLPDDVNAKEETTEKNESAENAENTESEEKTPPKTGAITNYLPDDYRYKIFEQTLDLYVREHLYEFTEEEVLHKFFADFLGDNPAFFATFMNYLLGTMDPYSTFHEGDSNFLKPNNSSVGFGFTLRDSDDGVFINSIVPDSNAEKAGLKDGDRFVSIGGIDVSGHTFNIVSAFLAKPQNYFNSSTEDTAQEAAQETSQEVLQEALQETKNAISEIEIVIERDGEQFSYKLSRGPMKTSEITSAIEENNGKPTAVIQVSSFLGENTDKEFNELVKKYADDGIKYLTIDLRDNGGGSLDLALSMVETFLEKDELICYYNDRDLEEPRPVYSTTEKVSFESITVLLNENSASASELFTSILQDKGIAKVVGTKSYGKSLGQEIYTLITGDYITLTTYQMLNEKFESYDGIGIIPDISIEEVEMCFLLPKLGVFNYLNFTEIKEGEYSDVTKALEDRLNVMGILREKYCDGIFDEKTKTAVYVLQKEYNLEATGYVTNETVSLITKIINSYKSTTYFDNTQYDVALIIHHSFSQGKRLAVEKERLREKQAALIEERDAALNAAYDAEHFKEEQTTENNN